MQRCAPRGVSAVVETCCDVSSGFACRCFLVQPSTSNCKTVAGIERLTTTHTRTVALRLIARTLAHRRVHVCSTVHRVLAAHHVLSCVVGRFVAWWAGPEDGPPCFQCDMCSASRCLQCDAAPYHAGQTCDEAGAGSVHDTLLSRLLTDGDIVACARYVSVLGTRASIPPRFDGLRCVWCCFFGATMGCRDNTGTPSQVWSGYRKAARVPQNEVQVRLPLLLCLRE